MSAQVRKWGGMHYVLFHCTAKDCVVTWKSTYFPEREQAEAYLEKAPKRGTRAKCLAHRAQEQAK